MVPQQTSRENTGNFRERKFPESQDALYARILGVRYRRRQAPGKGKPAANIGSTLPWTLCRPSVRGCFSKSTVPAFSSFSDFQVFEEQTLKKKRTLQKQLFQGKQEYTPPPWEPSFLGLSTDPEVTEQKKLWCIPFSWENKGKGYTP